MDEKTKDKLKLCLALSILLIIIVCVIIVIINYQVQGEKNMPYKLSKITIISTAEGVQNSDDTDSSKWNLNIYQNNDVYFFIDKNGEDAIINKVTIQNINVLKEPTVGKVKSYMPNSQEGRQFLLKEEYEIKDSLTYEGSTTSDTKKLTVANQGGTVLIRFANTQIGNYVSSEDDEIKHDGSLIKKLGYTDEDVAFDVNFDLIIEVNDIKYKANITLNLPSDGLCKDGISSKEITTTDNIVFKRIR